MDIASVMGILGSIIAVGVGVYAASNGHITPYVSLSSLLLPVAGSFFANMISFPLETTIKELPWAVKNIFSPAKQQPVKIIKQIITLAEKARKEGLLLLDTDADQVENSFLRDSIQLIVEGVDPETVRSILEIEIQSQDERSRSLVNYFYQWGSLAPSFGMLGTIIGLIGMFLAMENPNMLGPSLATALLTTLYGTVLANVVLNPFASKLQMQGSEEMLINEMILEGILSLQAGENPRIIEKKLLAFLAQDKRQLSLEKRKGEAN